MKIQIHAEIYRRTKEYARAQGKTTSEFVEIALRQFLGMEGMPLDDDAVYGRDDEQNSNTK